MDVYEKSSMKKPKKVQTTFTTYEVIESIGQGGSGIVYRAKDYCGDLFAIKILNPEMYHYRY